MRRPLATHDNDGDNNNNNNNIPLITQQNNTSSNSNTHDHNGQQEQQQQQLLVINDPLINVTDLLAEARKNNNKKKSFQNARMYLYLERIWIDDDEIATEFQQQQQMSSTSTSPKSPSFSKLEIVSCQGSRIPYLIETTLLQKNVKSFTLRKIASSCLDDCIHAFQLSGMRYIHELTLEVMLSEKSCQYLTDGLQSASSQIHKLRFERCTFENQRALATLSKGIQQNTSISSLAFVKCHLRDDDFEILFPQDNNLPSSIQYLDVMDNYCRSYLITKFNYSNLRCINLTNQHPGEFGGSLNIQLLSLILQSNTTVEELDLSFNMVAQYELTTLVDALQENTTLKKLSLMNNYLGDTAIQYIGSHLPQLEGLESLNITANRFGDHGASALLDGLKQNYHLKRIEMPRGFAVQDEILYLLALNQGGRRLLERESDDDSANSIQASPRSTLPLGAWSLVFERINRLPHDDVFCQPLRASVVYFLLQHGPALFENDA